MEPTFVTREQCEQLADLMNRKHMHFLDGRWFVVECKHRDDIVEVCVTLKNEDQSFYYPVEGRLDCRTEELTLDRAALFLVDYIDLYFEEYLTDGGEDLYLNIDWANHNWDTVNFQIRGQRLNRKLEAEADALLERGDAVLN